MKRERLNRKIVLFSHDPGGANTVIPLIRPLQAAGFGVLLYGKASALDKYAQAGFLGQALEAGTPEAIASFLEAQQPACLVTGTSANDFTEKYFWQAAKALNVPSLAILDQWMNYGIRFSAYGVAQASGYEADKRHPYLPDAIGVMDGFAKAEMANAGIPEGRIIVTGQPYFETVRAAYAGIDVMAARHRLGVAQEEQVVLVVSEPLEVSYGGTGYLGYTEKTVFHSIVQGLLSIDNHLRRRMCLIIKVHPRENAESYRDLVGSLVFKNIRLLVDHQSSPWDVLKISDAVLGMSSMLLLEAVLVGKPILSVQIGLRREDPFVLCRQGKISPVLEQTALLSAFQSEFLGDKVGDIAFSTPTLEIVPDAVGRVLQWVTANARSDAGVRAGQV